MVKKHPTELANLLATYEPNGTAMDMTIATLKRHKVAVLAAVTSPYSNGPIEGVNRLIKSLKRSCFWLQESAELLQTNLPNHGIT
ncbi:transposase [Lacticaseibacillus paracasei]|nr:transposase [Lacticaseibacillus paracasei]